MKLSTLLISASLAMAAASQANADQLLYNSFNGPDLSSPGQTGGGFASAYGSNFVSGGVAYVGGSGPADANIYSLATFDPTATRLTWEATGRASYGGAAVGWIAPPGAYACAGCGPVEIWLEARDDRTVFDFVNSNGLQRYYGGGPMGGFGPLTLSLTLTADSWAFSLNNGFSTISSSGGYVDGFALSDMVAESGGAMSTFGGSRSYCPSCGDYTRYASVDITQVPEPTTWALMLMGFGGLGAVLRSRRRSTLAAA